MHNEHVKVTGLVHVLRCKLKCNYMYMYMHVQYQERRVLWVRVPPEAAHFSDCLGCAVLLCLVVCLTLLVSFFLPSHLSL